MGIKGAKKYIQDLHRRQNDPFLWPDFLTGLPDKTAILRKLDTVLPKLGRYAIAYVRISNIQSYLIKYGPDRHAEVIQWAAAILKTSADSCSDGFAGTLSTHDFIVVCESADLEKLMEKAAADFRKIMEGYYSKEDFRKQTTLSFRKGSGQDIRLGLMRLAYVVADRKLPVRKSDLIINMAKVCDAIESTDDAVAVMTEDMLCAD